MTWHGSNVNEARALLQQQEGHGPAVSSRLGVIVYMPTSFSLFFLLCSFAFSLHSPCVCHIALPPSSILICLTRSSFALLHCHVHLHASQRGFGHKSRCDFVGNVAFLYIKVVWWSTIKQNTHSKSACSVENKYFQECW